MAIRKVGKNYYYYFKDEDGHMRTIPLGTSDLEQAKGIAKTIDEQRRGAKIYAKMQMAYADYVRRGTKSFVEAISPLHKTAGQGAQSAPSPVGTPEPMNEPEPVPPASRMDFDTMLATARKYRKSIGEWHCQVWRRFSSWCRERGVYYVQDVTPQIAQAYMNEKHANSKAKTYNNVKNQLNVIFRSALVEAGLSVSPFNVLLQRPLDDVSHHRDFTLDECRRIIDSACPYWKCLCVIALYTGLRLESCKRLAPSMIQDGVITIMPGKTARFNRAVAIPVMPELQAYLDTIPNAAAEPDKPFCQHFKSRLYWPRNMIPEGRRKENVGYFAGLLEHLGISDKNGETADFHSFRCAFITLLSEHGIEKDVIRGIVGHTSDDMTDLYNHDTESARTITKLSFLGDENS